ncbi:PREDICTED: putative disease resistance protein At1g50180 isoform X3 [Ipomoea nil]|uniref:putative disease resistance protein At1g50180 isoform X3 n=1 Tax=Ipomoea nil TaxID=35883 RepID=UPI0009011F23|nr:PREDICTED: putative disease resistance protein At1g50180 isoform X3 [Ipomoea nil]
MAGAVFDFIFEKFKELVFQEVIFLCQIKPEIQRYMDRLANLKAYAEDLGRGKQERASAKIWVIQLRKNSIELEDLLEEIMVDMELLERNTPPCNFCEVKSLIATLQSFAKRVKMQICFHLQLKAIDQKLRDHEEQKSKCDIQLNTNVGDNESLDWDRGYSQGFEAVGIDNEVKDMTDLIVNCRDCSMVITIWGLGGSGKTTMAKQVYEKVKDDGGFGCCSWADVNHSSDIKYLLKTIINGLYKNDRKEPPSELENADRDELERQYLNYLKGKRYVLFLDDVWDHNLLKKLKIQGGHASSIVITSRHREIADGSFLAGGVIPHYVEVKPLEFDLACSLFCRAAFLVRASTSAGGGTSAWPNNTIKEHGEELVRKCDGLPIAILAVGRLMSRKGDHPKEWRDALKNLDTECESSLSSINRALLLSYDELPNHLKYCFLYCAIFPKTYYLPAKSMIHMCVAEGFVIEKDLRGRTLEDIARDYFHQLRNRSLLQIVPDEIDDDFDRIEMHDLFRDLACLMFGREMFAEILDQNSIRDPKQRRLVSVDNVAPPIVELVNCENVKLRTLIIGGVSNFNPPFPQLLPIIKLLRVLVLEGLSDSVESLPNEVGDLINLRYISLRRTGIRQLPDSLGRLHNLQTLDVEDNPHLKRLPECVSELTKLRHIFGTELKVPDKVFTFSQLQTLYGIDVTPIQATELVNISEQLTKLKVEFTKAECWSDIRASTQQMGKLKSLMIWAMCTADDEILQFGNFSPPSQLEKLELFGFVVSARFTSIGDAAYLRSINLEVCFVNMDFFNCLGELPVLEFLSLGRYVEDTLICSDRSFPRLKKLWISFRIRKCHIGDGAMQHLESLTLSGCQNLKVLPEGLGELIDLKYLCIGDPTQELIGRMSEGGPDHWKVEHIPRITFEKHYHSRGYGE